MSQGTCPRDSRAEEAVYREGDRGAGAVEGDFGLTEAGLHRVGMNESWGQDP